MLRTDTGNFNRLLASLGLLLVAAALVIPYFYFRNTETLRIPEAELRALTDRGEATLRNRQDAIADLELWVVLLSLALVVGGVTLLVLGGKRLRIAQAKEDEAVDRRAQKEQVEIQRLSRDEVEEKREEQAREATQEPADEAGPGRPPLAGPAETPPVRSSTRLEPPPVRSGGGTVQQSREAIERIEHKVSRLFEDSFKGSVRYIPDVKIVGTSGGSQLKLDGLFTRSERRGDVVLDLKLGGVRLLPFRLRQYADRMLAGLARYRAVTGKDARGWLLIVIPEDAEGTEEIDQARIQNLFKREFVGAASGTVIEEQNLAQLPARFEELFEDNKNS